MLPYEGPPTANIMIVGDAPYGVDERSGRYFQGAVGETLDKVLREAGIGRTDCLVTTISRQKPPGDKLEFFFDDAKFLKPRPFFQEEVNAFRTKLEQLRPNLVIALGAVAMHYLTGVTGINAYRGYIMDCILVPGVKVMPVIHPATINMDWKLFFTTVLDVRKAARNCLTAGIAPDTRVLEYDQSVPKMIEFYDYLLNEHKGPIALDVETMSPGAHIDILGIADTPQHAMSVNFMLDRQTPRYELNLETKLWAKLGQVIETKELIMQNGTYDMGVLWKNNGILCKNYHRDIMVAAHAAWPECPRSLGFLASVCLNVPPWKHTAKESPELYNAADAANTFGIWNVMEMEMEKSGTRATHDFEMQQANVALMLQLQGILIDRERQKDLIHKHTTIRDETKVEIDTAIGRDINFNSPKQVAQLLYEEMALPKQFKRRRTSNGYENTLTTGADALAVLCRLSDNPVLAKIALYKKTVKLLTFLDCSVSPNSTVHTCYNTTGANMAHEGNGGAVSDEDDSFKSFGRWSSSASIIEPYGTGNLQNIPGTAREMYYAGDGKTFVQADYKQAEAVVVAYLIGDKKLQNLFKASFGLSDAECKSRNLDIHKITAASMAGYSVEFITTDEGLKVIFSKEVSGEMRRVGKTIRHAKNYCVSADTEVLTETGWKPIPEFNKFTDKVAQWEANGDITFVTAQETLYFPYQGPMLSFKNQSIDQLVSPGHRMPVFNRKDSKLKVIFSEHLHASCNGDNTMPLTGLIQQQGYQTISPVFMQLIVAMQADGSIRERGNKKELNFHLKKERKKIRLRSILEANGIDYSETLVVADDSVFFYISARKNKELFDFISLTNKHFGAWVIGLSPECLRTAVEESKWWDSRRNVSGDSWQYYSKDRENCAWLATMAHLTGYKAYVTSDHPNVFTCNIMNQQRTYAYRTHRTVEQYDGFIYSLKVPSSFYMIRRNGKISITGNSAGPGVLANKLGISMPAAKQLMTTYDLANPELQIWQRNDIQRQLAETRILTNLFGRKHKFLDRWGDDLFRSSYSYIPQSTVGDLLNKALIILHDEFGTELTIALQLHDAIYIAVDDNEAAIERGKDVLKHCMIERVQPLVCNNQEFFIDIDYKVGRYWGDLHD